MNDLIIDKLNEIKELQNLIKLSGLDYRTKMISVNIHCL